MVETQLIQELQREKNKVGLVSGSLKINEYDETDQNISASINPENRNIEINLRRGFNPIQDRKEKAYARKKKIQDVRKKLLEDILYHELAHWEMPFNSGFGCPYKLYNHDLILETVKQALPSNKQAHASYVANAFEDMIINPRVKEYKGDFSGQVLFWNDQGKQTKEKGLQSYTAFYEAFVKLNMHLFGDNVDKALLKRHYTTDTVKSKEIDKATQKVIQELGLPENIQDTRILFEKEKWQEMASIFTRNLADLLEETPIEKLSAFSYSEGDGGSKKSQAGNGLEQKIETRNGKEEIAYGRYSSGKTLSKNLTSYEQLDSLYRKLARAISVQVEATTREQGLEIGPLNFRVFNPEKDDIRKIKTTKIYLKDGEITFGYKREPIKVTTKSKVQIRSFPDFKLVVLDNSGSMKHGPNCDMRDEGNMRCNGLTTFIPWGDNSKYHYALLGFYGIENFLQQQGISQYIGHGVSLFSSSTRYQEENFREIEKLRKLALTPEFQGTRIDANTLLQALNGRESFVLSISDGEIGNWNNAKEDFYKLAEKNYFAHIQIGQSNQFTQDLENKKFPVFYVNSGQELSRLMVNITNKTYRSYTQK